MDNVLMQGRVEIFTFTASEKQSFENLSRRDGILGHQLDKISSLLLFTVFLLADF
jgi:hypothetical protein